MVEVDTRRAFDHGMFVPMKLLFPEATVPTVQVSLKSNNWLDETLTSHNLDEDVRIDAVRRWSEAPSARLCHPREEHLLPLHVCVGAARTPAAQVIPFELLVFSVRCYVW